MEDLPILFKQSPGLQQINLEFSEINSLEPLLPLLSQFTDLKELLLFGNRLEDLPEDLSCLKYLEKLDISNNLIEDTQTVLPSLATLPCLIDLHISIQSEGEEKVLLKTLKNLQYLNGTEVDREFLENSDLGQIKEVLSYESTDKLQETNEKIEKTYISCENIGFLDEESSLSRDYVEKIAGFYDEIRELWQGVDKTADKKLAEDFEDGIKSIAVELSEILKSDYSDISKRLYSIKSKQDLSLICAQKLSIFLSIKQPDFLHFFKIISELSQDLFAELLSVCLESFQSIRKSVSDPPSPKGGLDKEIMKRFQEERAELLEEIQSLREENEKYLNMLIKHSKQSANKLEDRFKPEGLKKHQSLPSLKISSKPLSLRQTKEIIEEIYFSKNKYDERCVVNKMPRETMEQHMYNYLNTKYGLKNLILDWASSIISSVKKYAVKDNDVKVFGKILKNECDEEFRFVQRQVKETVAELLRLHFKTRNPFLNTYEIQLLVQDRLEGYLYQDEWQGVIKFMYNEEDNLYLMQEIQKQISKRKRLNKHPAFKGKVSREEAILIQEKEKILKSRVRIKDFLKILLDFQLEGHEKFLTRFTQIFRQFDLDCDGIINEEQFRELVREMDLGFTDKDIIRLLQIIDPYNNQQITFSETVRLFSTELIPIEGVAVMKKLSLDD